VILNSANALIIAIGTGDVLAVPYKIDNQEILQQIVDWLKDSYDEKAPLTEKSIFTASQINNLTVPQ
jgi:hypothetical protein